MKPIRLLPLIGIALFAYIIWNIGPVQIAETFQGIEPFMFLASLALAVPLVAIKAWKWKMLVNALGLDYGLKHSLESFYVAMFIGSVTPGKLGDFARALYTRSSGLPLGKGVGSVLVDRFMDIFVLLVLALAGVVYFLGTYGVGEIYMWSITIVLAAFLLVVAMSTRIIERVLEPAFSFMVPKSYRQGSSAAFADFSSSVKDLRKAGLLASVFVLTALSFLGVFLQYTFLGISLGLPLGYGFMASVIPIVLIVEMVPVSFSGLGTRDATLIFFFGLLGLSAVQAVSFSLVILLYSYLSVLPGLLLWLRRPARFRD